MYDRCCIAARERVGIPKDERYNYSILGCVEFGVQGKEQALTELVRLNLPKVLNLMLQEGTDEMSGEQFRLGEPKKLSEIRTYEELYNWYLVEIAYFINLAVDSTRTFEKLYEEKYPLPYLSVLTEDCIRRAKDISEGGARYNSVGFNLCGIATATDSLLAIKKMVFDEKKISLEDFARILRNDYSQEEYLRQKILRTCEKFGNDREDVDRTAVALLEFANHELENYRTYHGGCYRLGLYSVEDHAIMGTYTGATPDGRRAGVSLSNSMGAVQGMDQEGPTALIKSVNRFDMSFAANGMVLDIKFIPSFLEGKTGQNALKNLILTYFHHGGMEIQISVVSREILLAAQREPEKYQNLIVRVSGFSAYFLSLRKVTQDEIIARTECGK
jgi:formate C-acetyltransferase